MREQDPPRLTVKCEVGNNNIRFTAIVTMEITDEGGPEMAKLHAADCFANIVQPAATAAFEKYLDECATPEARKHCMESITRRHNSSFR